MQYERRWQRIFRVAAWWNVLVGAGGLIAPRWGIELFYGANAVSDDLIARLAWGDFSVCVLLFGVGYFIVARDVRKNHGLVVLGVLGKAGVLVSFPLRFFAGEATGWILIPAAVDGTMAMLFVVFLARRQRLLK